MEEFELLTVEELALMLKWKPKTIYNQKDNIPHVKINGSLRFVRNDILNWISKSRVNPIPKCRTKLSLKQSNEDLLVVKP
jgi:hypothetical protein